MHIQLYFYDLHSEIYGHFPFPDCRAGQTEIANKKYISYNSNNPHFSFLSGFKKCQSLVMFVPARNVAVSPPCHTADPVRAGEYEQHESSLRFSARAATPFSDRKGHNDSSVSLWRESVKFRMVPHTGRCHEFLMFTLNWEKVRRKWKFRPRSLTDDIGYSCSISWVIFHYSKPIPCDTHNATS